MHIKQAIVNLVHQALKDLWKTNIKNWKEQILIEFSTESYFKPRKLPRFTHKTYQ